MQPTYTPGPWHITETEPGIEADMDVFTTTPRWAGGKGLIARVIDADDACLIAAAPDMLQALKDIFSLLQREGASGVVGAEVIARAAIAKATNA